MARVFNRVFGAFVCAVAAFRVAQGEKKNPSLKLENRTILINRMILITGGSRGMGFELLRRSKSISEETAN